MLWISMKTSFSIFSLKIEILCIPKNWTNTFLDSDLTPQASSCKTSIVHEILHMYIPKSPSSIQYIWKCNLLYVKWKMQFSNAWQQVLVKWSDTICYLVSYSHLQHDKLHFSRALRSKGSWHAFIDLHRLYACIPVCRQIVPRVNSSHHASVSRKLQSSQGSQDGVRLGKRDTCSPLESQNLY